jgi:malonate transporter
MPSISKVFLETLIPVFFVLGLGYYAGLRRRLDNDNVGALTTTLMQFALPCSLFLGIAKTSPALLRSQSPLLGVLALAMLLTYGLVFWISRTWFRVSVSQAAVQSLTVSFSNNVAIGLPLLSSLYGPSGLLAVAAGIMAGALVVSPITLVLLEIDAETYGKVVLPLGRRVRSAVLAALRRPIVLAPLLALIVPVCGFTLPVLVVSSLDLLGKATVGLALFLTGLILSAQKIQFSGSVAVGLLFKNIAQPALVALLLVLFRLHGQIAAEAFLLAAVPAGFFGTVFGARYGVKSMDASSTLLLSTALSIATLSLAIVLLGKLG